MLATVPPHVDERHRRRVNGYAATCMVAYGCVLAALGKLEGEITVPAALKLIRQFAPQKR